MELRDNLDPDAGKSEQQVIDELTGQTSLFDDKRFTEENEKDKDWLKKQQNELLKNKEKSSRAIKLLLLQKKNKSRP